MITINRNNVEGLRRWRGFVIRTKTDKVIKIDI